MWRPKNTISFIESNIELIRIHSHRSEDERRLERKCRKTRPSERRDNSFLGVHRMSRVTFLIIIAAMIAGAIGFGIAVYAVPLEEIVQFRALINAGLGAISTTNHPDDSNTVVEHPKAPRSKAPRELDTPTQTRSDADSARDPRSAKCLGGSPTVAPTPTDIPNRDVSTPRSGSGGELQAPENGPAASVPSSAPSAGSGDKASAAPGSHLKPPAKKSKPKSAPPSNSEN